MKKFVIYLLVIVMAVSLGFAVFFLVRDNEVISISNATIYKDVNQQFKIDVTHLNKKPSTKISISVSDENIVKYDEKSSTFTAKVGGVARINYRTTNVKFRNLWCDVIVGDGTVESPFYISTPEQLAAIGMGVMNSEGIYAGNEDFPYYTSDACYKLVANIDAKDINNGYWIPLRKFSGRFDGNGFTISNIDIDIDSYKEMASKEGSTYDPNIFSKDNVGFFQEITAKGRVYNLKFENYYATGSYTNFGLVSAQNYGQIERIEIKNAKLSTQTKIFGGITAINKTTESGDNTTYQRHIARIDRCSVNMDAGRKTIYNSDGTTQEQDLPISGNVGGLVGLNQGGTIVYSYVNGNILIGDDSENPIIFGGLISENSYIKLQKYAGNFVSEYQGASIKDSYSNLKVELNKNISSSSMVAGAIAKNLDYSNSNFDGNVNKKVVCNFLIGVYYNKDNLNIAQEGITKEFNGIAQFKCEQSKASSITLTYSDNKPIVYGLSTEELQKADNFDSHSINEISFDDNGVSQGITTKMVKWLFGTVWAIDIDTNNSMPYLNYQLVYIPDDFITAGTPIIEEEKKYTFENAEVDYEISIVNGSNGKLWLTIDEEMLLKVSPKEAKVSWVSSNNSVVSIDSTGKIKALQKGSVTIAATTKNGSTDSITVIVTDASYVITNYPLRIDVDEGSTYQISNVKVTPNTALTYSSSNTNVVTVEENSGLVKGVGVGNTTIMIKAGTTQIAIPVYCHKKDDSHVGNVNITLNTTSISGNYGSVAKQGQIIVTKATCNNIDTDIKDILQFNYSSNNNNVITIDSNGNYKVVGVGRATIAVNVITSGYTGTAYVYVDIKADEIENSENLILSDFYRELSVGESFTIRYSGTRKRPEWISFDSSIATVDTFGTVTAVKFGTTTISATIKKDDGSYITRYCSISVLKGIEQTTIVATPPYQEISTGVAAVINVDINKENVDYTYTYSKSGSEPTINKYGDRITVLFVEPGQVTLTIKASDGSNATTQATVKAKESTAYTRYIKHYSQLNAIRYNKNRDYVLAANIDLAIVDNWVPIGTKDDPFTGKIRNAGSYKITNLKTQEGLIYSGLFGYTKGANIDGLIIDNARVTGDYSGAIVGYANNTMINNCKVKNSEIDAKISAGGIIGIAESTSAIADSQLLGNSNIFVSNGTKTACVGGIIGCSYSSTITDCKVQINGMISLGSGRHGYAGGIVGYTTAIVTRGLVDGATIIANNSDYDYAGGIVGYSINGINIATINNSRIEGYYAGGIGGALNNTQTITLKFDQYKKGYRRQDLSYYQYSKNVYKVAVKENTSVKGMEVGGLFGIIKAGVVSNCYTRATLYGIKGSANKGGFASEIKASNFNNDGGRGAVGIVEYCYAACKFEGSGDNFAITSSLVHNHISFGSDVRTFGYCFNYIFDDDLDGGADYTCKNNLFSRDEVHARKSTKEMKEQSTYTDKGFSGSWSFGAGYPTLKNEL